MAQEEFVIQKIFVFKKKLNPNVYDAMYQCRLCDEIFSDYTTDNEELAIMAVSELAYGEESFCVDETEFDIHQSVVHCCKDGSYGLADFLGFMKRAVGYEN